MDDDGSGYRNLQFCEQDMKRGLGLRLSSSAERVTKPFLKSGAFLYRDCSVSQSLLSANGMQMDFVGDEWMSHRDSCVAGISHRDGSLNGIGIRDGSLAGFSHRDGGSMIDHRDCSMQGNGHKESNMDHLLQPNLNYATILSSAADSQSLQMLQPSDPPKDNLMPKGDEAILRKGSSLRKRTRGKSSKAPKTKMLKKSLTSNSNGTDPSCPHVNEGVKKITTLVINGIYIDLSGIPPPMCSCTGTQQQCYRWGIGGWQSACCTTSLSMHPLPMSTKRKGARIAGRKMSQGAFAKVLEKLAGEGHQFKDPIDLKLFWAKHGTNKFVTIR